MAGERGAQGASFYLNRQRELIAALTVDIAVAVTAGAIVITGAFDTDNHPRADSVSALAAGTTPELGAPQTTTIHLEQSFEQAIATTTIPAETTTSEPATTSTLLEPSTTTSMLPTTTQVLLQQNREIQSESPETRRTRDQRCQQAIANANVTPAPGYFITCGPEYLYNSGEDGDTCGYYYRDMPEAINENSGQPRPKCLEPNSGVAGQTRIHPDDSDSDAEWVETVKHEAGHQHCFYKWRDETEGCANTWASQH